MKLEDCTKEELIYFIKRNVFVDLDGLEFEVLMCRSVTVSQKSRHERECANKALGEYIEALRPYEGMRMVDIPNSAIKKASNAGERYKRHEEAATRYDKQYDSIQKQIDQNLKARRSD